MFGFDPQDWKRARAQVYEVLVDRARMGVPIPYSELASRIDAIHLDLETQKDRTALGWLLGDVSRETHDQRIGMLSALAILKGDKPAPPFFRLGKELGYHFTDQEEFWIGQCNRVIEHYRD